MLYVYMCNMYICIMTAVSITVCAIGDHVYYNAF